MGYASERRARRTPASARLALLLGAWICLLAGLLPGPCPAFAQHRVGSFGRYGPEHGLSNPNVLAIWQDREGFMWFGTEDGLNRFDGSRFTAYRHDPADSTSISQSWVTDIVEDDAGSLWISTKHNGFNRFDPRKKTFTRYPYDVADSSKGIVRGGANALVYRDQELWIGVYGAGVTRLDLRKGTYLHYDRRTERFASFYKNDTRCLTVDREGYVWVGREAHGVARIDPRTHTFVNYTYDRADPSTIRSDIVRAIHADAQGDVWIGMSGGGLDRFDHRTGTFQHFQHDPNDPTSISHNTVWSVFEDSRGTIWAGTYGGGLNRFDRATGTFTRFRHDPNDPTSLPSDNVLSIFEDRSGLLWFGTESGAATFNPASEGITHYDQHTGPPSALLASDVFSILERPTAPNTFWVGTNGGGIHLLDLQTQRVTPVVPATSGADLHRLSISSIVEDSSGTLWIGTLQQGLFSYDPHTNALTSYLRPSPGLTDPVNVYAVVVDEPDTVWVGTAGGLHRLNRATKTYKRFNVDPNEPGNLNGFGVSCLLRDSRGRLWIGTENGVSRHVPGSDRFIRYRHDRRDTTSLSHNYVYALYESGDGVLWVATYGGLNRFDPETERFTRYTTKNGLSSDIVYGIAGGDDGIMWLTTSQGLSRLDPATGQTINYGTADGLPSARFNRGVLARSQRGDLLLGGPDGLDVFLPTVLQHKRYRPALAITAFKKFGVAAGADLPDGVPIRLRHDDTYFSFDFALLDYTNPGEHSFRFRLEGFDTAWQRADGPIGSAHYRNDERFGSFVFHVQGIDSKGRTNERRLLVVIVPPWWRTPWFRALCLAGALALTATTLTYGYRRKQQELAEKRRMLSHGREQERHFLARELHDVPLQNLYSARHRLEVIAREVHLNGQAPDLEAARGLLEQTAEDLRRICGELRPPSLGPFGLSKAIRSHLRGFEEAHPEIVVDFDLQPDGQRLPEATRLALFRIYQGAISNVARHAQAGHVGVRFGLDDAEVTLEVEDDGKGFVVPRNWLEMARQQHYGLLGIAEWVDSIGGVLTVRSAPGEGALLQVRVPLARERRPLLHLLPAPLMAGFNALINRA